MNALKSGLYNEDDEDNFATVDSENNSGESNDDAEKSSEVEAAAKVEKKTLPKSKVVVNMKASNPKENREPRTVNDSTEKDEENHPNENTESESPKYSHEKEVFSIDVFDPGGTPAINVAKEVIVVKYDPRRKEIEGLDNNDAAKEGENDAKAEDDVMIEKMNNEERRLFLPPPLCLLWPPVWDPGGWLISPLHNLQPLQTINSHGLTLQQHKNSGVWTGQVIQTPMLTS